MTNPVFIAVDIGGTWLKAAAFEPQDFDRTLEGLWPETFQEPGSLGSGSGMEFGMRVAALVRAAAGTRPVAGIGIATPGIVNPAGSGVSKCALHLQPLDDPAWIHTVRQLVNAECVLINDAQAGLCGAAQLHLLPASGTVGFMAVGTGLGFVIWKNGKLWNPGRSLPLLGSVRTPAGSYDEIASASRLAAGHPSGKLDCWLADPACVEERTRYFSNLKAIIGTAATLYQLDRVIVGGGLSGAAQAASFPLEKVLADTIAEFPELDRFPVIQTAVEGNRLNLLGAAALAAGHSVIASGEDLQFDSFTTEAVLRKNLHLEKLGTAEILALMHSEESEAGARLGETFAAMAPMIDEIAESMDAGGRIIYVGAGTSGRLAALDAVELPCTFGSPLGEAAALIAGGSSEALDTIETGAEEDCSSVPDLLLIQPGPLDTIIGISASGSSFFVRSALAFGKSRGSRTIMIREAPDNETSGPFEIIPLRSGSEILQGSTRLKAGTATKRVLNALTTGIMIRRGKVRGSSMIDLHCLNEKLRTRAIRILRDLYGLEEADGRILLEQSGWNLRQAIDGLDKKLADFPRRSSHPLVVLNPIQPIPAATMDVNR